MKPIKRNEIINALPNGDCLVSGCYSQKVVFRPVLVIPQNVPKLWRRPAETLIKIKEEFEQHEKKYKFSRAAFLKR